MSQAPLQQFYIPEEQSVYLLSHHDARKLKDWVALCQAQLWGAGAALAAGARARGRRSELSAAGVTSEVGDVVALLQSLEQDAPVGSARAAQNATSEVRAAARDAFRLAFREGCQSRLQGALRAQLLVSFAAALQAEFRPARCGVTCAMVSGG